MKKIKFIKPALNLDEKIKLLKSRGLVISDEKKAKHYLLHVGYFRLTGYFKFFQNKETNVFIDGTTFEQAIDLYGFDRELRLLTLDAIEKIEVSLKSVINYEMYKKHGIFWYTSIKNFDITKYRNLSIFCLFVSKLRGIKNRSSSVYVKDFFKKHDNESLPSWMLFEELTIGEVSNIFRIVNRKDKQIIADHFGVYQLDLQIWMQLLVNIRNISAHHSRLWNKKYIISPRTKDSIFSKAFTTYENSKGVYEVSPNYRNTSLIINHLLRTIHPGYDFGNRLEKLFSDYSDVDISKMGFENDWKNSF